MQEISDYLIKEIIFKPSIFSGLFWIGILYILIKIISKITKKLKKTR